MSKYARRLVNLEQTDIRIVQRTAREKGLGGKGFSAALRLIIREWQAQQEAAASFRPRVRLSFPRHR